MNSVNSAMELFDKYIYTFCLIPEVIKIYPNHKEWLNKCLSERRKCMVLRTNDHIVGCGIIKEKHDCDNTLKISMMYVDPNERRKGYGSDIINNIINYALSNEYASVYLAINKQMPNYVRDFYGKHGFVKSGIFSDSDDLWILKIGDGKNI